VETVFETAPKNAAETKQMENIKLGKKERGWVDASLARLGCVIEV
jgi:hypothetical protein